MRVREAKDNDPGCCFHLPGMFCFVSSTLESQDPTHSQKLRVGNSVAKRLTSLSSNPLIHFQCLCSTHRFSLLGRKSLPVHPFSMDLETNLRGSLTICFQPSSESGASTTTENTDCSASALSMAVCCSLRLILLVPVRGVEITCVFSNFGLRNRNQLWFRLLSLAFNFARRWYRRFRKLNSGSAFRGHGPTRSPTPSSLAVPG